eukprot:gene14841-19947_t
MADTTTTTSDKTDVQDSQQPKRRRKSGWDVPSIPNAGSTTTDSVTATISTNSAVMSTTIGATIPNLGLSGLPVNQLLFPVPQPLNNRIYVGSIHYDIKQSDVAALFSSFGLVTKVEMSMDPATGKSKGFCFIEYSNAESALAAQAMDGFELAGRKIKVGRPLHGIGAPVNPLTMGGLLGINPLLGSANTGVLGLPNLNPLQIPLGLQSTSSGLTPTRPEVKNCILVRNISPSYTAKAIQDMFGAYGAVISCSLISYDNVQPSVAMIEFESIISAQTSVTLMNNFSLSGLKISIETMTKTEVDTELKKLKDEKEKDYTSVMLENMVEFHEASDPDLKDEINEEASNYGGVEKIDIIADKVTQTVKVLLKYSLPSEAAKAVKAMNGRSFGSQKIKAKLIP